MQDIIIVCAGSYGREVYWALQENNRLAAEKKREEPYHILGFLSDVPVDLEHYGIKSSVLGNIQDWQPKGNEKYALGLGKPEDKKKLADMLRPRGMKFINIISDWVSLTPDVKIGEGCMITTGSYIGCDVELGDFVNINGSMIYSGARIEDYSTTTGFTVVEPSIVHEGVYIGSKAVITEGCEVGSWSKVSAGSVVTQDIRSGVTVFGMPAQEIG